MSYSFDGIYRSTSWALQEHMTAMALLQEQVTTGSRINRSSDAPSDANRLLTLNSSSSKLSHYMKEIEDLSGRLSMAGSQFDMISDQVTDFRTRVTSAMSQGKDGRKIVAGVMNGIIEMVVSLANSEHEGQKLFGGDDSKSTPYLVERSGGEITRVYYQGSYKERKVEVAENVEISSVFVGDDIFREDNRQPPELIGNETGVTLGTGTSTVQGYSELEITTSGPNYVISIDGGLSSVTVPVGGEANTAVTDSRTGKVLYLDTTTITGTGKASVHVPGSYDIFNLMITMRDLLASDDDVEAQLNALGDELEGVHSKITVGFSVIGGRATTLDLMRDGFENVKYNNDDEKSRLADADIAQVSVDLLQRETLYQMSLGIAGKLLSTSLMDFI